MARPIQPEQSELVKKTVFSYIVSSAKFKYNLTENRIKFASRQSQSVVWSPK